MAPIQQSFHFFSRYGVTLSVLFVMAGIGAEIVSINLSGSFTLEEPWNSTMAALIGAGIFEPIATGAAIFFIASRDKGDHLSVYDCVMKALNVYTQMLICYMATTLLVLFGLSLYVIPGIFFLYKLIFTEYFIILKDDEPLEAIQHSFERTQGKAAILLPAFSLILVVLLICNMLIEAAVTSLGGTLSLKVLGTLVEAPLMAFAVVVGYRLFTLTADSASESSV